MIRLSVNKHTKLPLNFQMQMLLFAFLILIMFHSTFMAEKASKDIYLVRVM